MIYYGNARLVQTLKVFAECCTQRTPLDKLILSKALFAKCFILGSAKGLPCQLTFDKELKQK
jgi:hypothetical protein